MSFTDKNITCVECGQSFVFSAGEQETYQQRGFLNEPKRCGPCRAARKDRMGGGGGGRGFGGGGGGGGFGGRGRGGGGGSGERHTATCADCGREASLPFKPRGDRPVYCSDCFRNHRA
jgi:CxxC-x17-CxxC domain-containing protein